VPRFNASASLTILALLVAGAAPSSAQALVNVDASQFTLRFGVLLQPAYEAAESPTADGTQQNLYLRRFRLGFAGTIGSDLEYFISPNLPNAGKYDPTTGKKAPTNLQVPDAFVSYHLSGNALMVDAGSMVPPQGRAAMTGVVYYLGWDAFANAARQAPAINGNGYPEDTGVELRGLVLDGHLEYRAGGFQGQRSAPTATPATVPGRNALRTSARVQWNVLDPDAWIFYRGTYLGEKRVLSFGAFYDRQDAYRQSGADLLLDLPMGGGVLTVEADHVAMDGGAWLPTVPRQRVLMAQAGWQFLSLRLAPVLRVERLSFAAPTPAALDETRTSLGLSWFPHGHNGNVKLFYTRVKTDNLPTTALKTYGVLNAVWQAFYF
jgi:hypothetical protein